MERIQEKNDDKKCYVCSKNFGIMSKGKQCKLCLKFICKEHTLLNSLKNEICILCEINQIKNKRKKAIQDEINKIKEENQIEEQNLRKIDLEKCEKIKNIQEIDKIILENERFSQVQENKLNQLLQDQKEKNEKARIISQELKEKLNKETALEKMYIFEREELEVSLQAINSELIVVKDKKQQLGLELEYMNVKFSSCLAKDLVEPILCHTCKKILNEKTQEIHEVREENDEIKEI